MSKTGKIILLLLLILPALELYQLFPRGVRYHFYPLNPGRDEAIRWYVKDVTWRIFVVGLCLFLYFRERSRRDGYPELTLILPVYFGMDFMMYLLNHSAAGIWYTIVYAPILIYGTYLAFKRQIWQAAEWAYARYQKIINRLKRKRKGNGNSNS